MEMEYGIRNRNHDYLGIRRLRVKNKVDFWVHLYKGS